MRFYKIRQDLNKVSEKQYYIVRTPFMMYRRSTSLIKTGPLLVPCTLPPQNYDFKIYPTPLCSSHGYNYDKACYIVSSYPKSHKTNLC